MRIYPGDLLSWHDVTDISFHLYEYDINLTDHVLRYLYTIWDKKFTFYHIYVDCNSRSSCASFDVF